MPRAPLATLLLAIALAGCSQAPPMDAFEAAQKHAVDVLEGLPYPPGGNVTGTTGATAFGKPGAGIGVEYPPGTNASRLLDDFRAALDEAGWRPNVTAIDEDEHGLLRANLTGSGEQYGLACSLYPKGAVRGTPRDPAAVVRLECAVVWRG